MKNHVIPLVVTLALMVGVQLACAQPTVIPLYSFTNALDGSNILAGLVQANDRNFYGTAYGGGTNSYGAVFRITPSGVFTPLYSFTNGNDGAHPRAGLVQAGDGNLYGTTYAGGTHNFGTVFRITTSGTLTPLYSFTDGNDGGEPDAGLVLASDGNLYGTTPFGGTNAFYGTIFRITTSGTLTPLYSFTGGYDGANPYTALVQASDGNLYGTAPGGGTNGVGTVFRITTSGALTPLYSFTGGRDGALPYGGLMQASDGYLYGTTAGGGTNNSGTVFRITTNGALTPFYSFTALQNNTNHDGANPFAGLLQASDGYLYGTADEGGVSNDGTVFRITTNGVFTLLYSFTGGNGQYPAANLIQGNNGNLYGTTDIGGAKGDGTLFELALLSPPLNILPHGNQSILLWPTWAINYVVQSTTNLASPNWVALTNAVVTIAVTNTVTVTNSLHAQFFRLANP